MKKSLFLVTLGAMLALPTMAADGVTTFQEFSARKSNAKKTPEEVKAAFAERDLDKDGQISAADKFVKGDVNKDSNLSFGEYKNLHSRMKPENQTKNFDKLNTNNDKSLTCEEYLSAPVKAAPKASTKAEKTPKAEAAPAAAPTEPATKPAPKPKKAKAPKAETVTEPAAKPAPKAKAKAEKEPKAEAAPATMTEPAAKPAPKPKKAKAPKAEKAAPAPAA